jgi:hypothetical protein
MPRLYGAHERDESENIKKWYLLLLEPQRAQLMTANENLRGS